MHNCVLFRGQRGRQIWRLRSTNRVCSVQVTGPLDVDDIPAAHQAILAGIGIGSISLFSSQRMEGLVRVLPSYIYADLPINLVWPSKRLEPARVVLLREFLVTKLSAQRWRG